MWFFSILDLVDQNLRRFELIKLDWDQIYIKRSTEPFDQVITIYIYITLDVVNGA